MGKVDLVIFLRNCKVPSFWPNTCKNKQKHT